MAKKHIMHHKKVHVTHKKPRKVNVALIVILFIIAIVAAYVMLQDKAVATVNGEKISAQRVDVLYSSLAPGSTLTKQEIVQRLIDAKLLVQYIEESGYGLSEEEFQRELASRLSQSGVSEEDLKKQLALRGATLDDVKETIVIELFVNKHVIPQISISTADIQAYRISTNSTLTDDEIRKVLFIDQQKQIVAQIIENYRKTSTITVDEAYR
jgi:hypothetical protein